MRKQTLGNSMTAALVWMVALPGTVLSQADEPAIQLPEGEAKALIEGTCIACHQLDYIPNSAGYTHDGWEKLILKIMLQSLCLGVLQELV